MAVNIMTELGVTGLNQSGGIIEEEFLRQLQGERWRRTVKEMRDNDPVIGAILYAIDMLTRQVKWQVVPGSDSAGDVAAAEFVSECLYDMSTDWSGIVSEIMTMLPWGWAYLETVYKVRRGPDQKNGRYRSRYNDGRIGWRKWAIRAQDTLDEWAFDDNGGVVGMWQVAPPTYERKFIPVEKALLFRTSVRKGNPEGRSILRNVYRPWYFKKNFENTQAIGIERDLAGLPVGWVPPEILDQAAGAQEKAALAAIKKMLLNIRRDEQEAIVFPLAYDENSGKKLYDLQLLSSGGQRQFDIDKVLRYYDSRIAMTALADFILLGHENVGSYALSSNKTNLFAVALGSYLDSIGGMDTDGRPVGVVNQYAIPRLLRVNNMAVENQPVLVHGDIESISLEDIANYISRLAGAGMPFFPDDDLEAFLKQQAGIPVTG